MKNIKKIITPLIVGVLLGACTPDITELPQDRLTPDNYFSSENELRLWTNKFYYQLDNAGEFTGQDADDVIDNYLSSLMQGDRSPFNEKGWNWSMLRDINYYLQYSSSCKNQSVREHYDGVAYFFRAYFYFEKVRKYGDVPIYSEVIGTDDEQLLLKPRDPRSKVIDYVISDLDKAIKLLPEGKNAERVTKWTALALKSRVALFEGTFQKYHNLGDSEKYLQECVKAGEEFIQSSGYSLYDLGAEPYRSLFNDTEKSGKFNKEVILWRVYSKEANVTNAVQFELKNGRQSLTRRFMNHYLMADGQRFSQQPDWQTKSFVEEVKNRDPRLAQTVLTPGYVQVGASKPTKNTLESYTGYQPIKYVASSKYDGAGQGIINLPLFRTSEVYLNYAEAKAELGTLTQEDLDMSINKIRKRARMPNLDMAQANANISQLMLSYYPNVTKGANEGVILEIRRERTVELVMEAFRQWDLLRWREGEAFKKPFQGIYFPGVGEYDLDGDGTPDIVIYTGNAPSFQGKKFKLGKDIVLSDNDKGYVVALANLKLTWQQDRDYLWPIPAEQRVITHGILTQNPNWKDGLSF